MLLNIEKSGEQDQVRSEEWLVNTDPICHTLYFYAYHLTLLLVFLLQYRSNYSCVILTGFNISRCHKLNSTPIFMCTYMSHDVTSRAHASFEFMSEYSNRHIINTM